MLFAGIRRKHTFTTMSEGLSAQWRDFEKLGSLPEQIGKTAYGAICGVEIWLGVASAGKGGKHA